MRRFVGEMRAKPEGFADRLDDLFQQPPAAAAASLEALTTEVLALVQREMPEIDVTKMQRRVGGRRPRWDYPEDGAPQ